MSAPTKGQLQAMNEELQETIRQLEKMSAEAMALARRARNDADEIEMAAAHYKQQRDRLIGYIEGTRTDRDRDLAGAGGVVMSPGMDRPARTRVDEFLEANRREPEIVNGVARRRP